MNEKQTDNSYQRIGLSYTVSTNSGEKLFTLYPGHQSYPLLVNLHRIKRIRQFEPYNSFSLIGQIGSKTFISVLGDHSSLLFIYQFTPDGGDYTLSITREDDTLNWNIGDNPLRRTA